MRIAGVDTASRRIAVVDLAAMDFQEVHVAASTPAQEVSELAAGLLAMGYHPITTLLYVEEPIFVQNQKTAMRLAMTVGALMAVWPCDLFHLVHHDKWKKEVIGRGGVNKVAVRAWLEANHPQVAEACGRSQDLVDASCIALYGHQHAAANGLV